MTFHEWLLKNDPLFMEALDRRELLNLGAMGGGFALGAGSLVPAAKKTYDFFTKPMNVGAKKTDDTEEIIPGVPGIKKKINVLHWISKVVPDKAKFVRDFANLKPGSDLSIGQETRKEMFNRNVWLFVISPEQIEKMRPNAYAFAELGQNDKGGNYIVMPTTAFSKLPTATTDGELTVTGAQTLAHELRHTTQNRDAAPKARQGDESSISDTADRHSYYMKRPPEMGVRLAATKNMMNKDDVVEALVRSTKKQDIMRYIKNPKTKEDESQIINIPKNELQKMFQEALPDDEKQLFKFFYTNDPKKLQNAIAQTPTFQEMLEKYSDKVGETFSDNFGRHHMNLFLKQFTDANLESYLNKSKDASSLYNFYKTLSGNDKATFFKELWNAYDTVVKGAGLVSKFYNMA